jgi:hypothetical protein
MYNSSAYFLDRTGFDVKSSDCPYPELAVKNKETKSIIILLLRIIVISY